MILLANVYVDLYRSSYTAGGATDAPRPYMEHVEAHLTRIKDSPLMAMSSSVLTAQYELYFENGTDVQRGDQVANIIRKDNGRQFFPGRSDEIYMVTDATDSTPGFVEYRDVTVKRIVGGGPIQ